MSAAGDSRKAELASFLRSRRERLTPESVGLDPRGSRRRVKGLRREEVALLADVGVAWYTWLEQGRPIAISAEALERIALALQLNSSEIDYLEKLVRPRAEQPHIWEMQVDKGVRYLVEHFKDGFAYLRNRRYDFLAWNEKLGRFLKLDRNASELERNALWKLFADKDSRAIYASWDDYAHALVAAFRAEYADYIGDPDFEGLIEALHAASPEFTRLWTHFHVLTPSQWVIKEAPMRDPDTGEVVPLSFDSLHFTVSDYPEQVVVFGIVAKI